MLDADAAAPLLMLRDVILLIIISGYYAAAPLDGVMRVRYAA